MFTDQQGERKYYIHQVTLAVEKKEKNWTASIKPSVSHKVEVKKLSFDHGPFPYAASIPIDIFIQSFNPLKTLFTKVKSKQKIYC